MIAAVEGLPDGKDSPLDVINTSTQINKLNARLSYLQQEVSKLTKGKTILSANTKQLNYNTEYDLDSDPATFAGNFNFKHISYAYFCKHINWILDTGATDHMSLYQFLFKSLELLSKQVLVY